MTINETQLMERKTIDTLINAYQQACQEVDQGYKLLEQAQLRMNQAFGEHYSDFSTVERNYGGTSRLADEIKIKLRQNAWKCIINRLQIERVMSLHAQEDLHKRLDGQDIPELTQQTVFDVLQAMSDQSTDYFKQMILEVYDLLMPGKSQHDHYKTNQKYGRNALGKKVILSCYLEHNYGGGMRVTYRQEDRLI